MLRAAAADSADSAQGNTRVDRRSLLAAMIAGVTMFVSARPVRATTSVLQAIDVHAHFIPDAYRAATVAAGHAKPDGMPGIPAWSEREMLAMMDRQRIRTAVLSISSPGVHFGDDSDACKLARSVNLEGARLKAAHPSRFGFLASLPLPDVDGALAEIAFAHDELGADGFILESNSGGIYPGDPRFEPVHAELDRRSAVVLLHPTSPHCPSCSLPGRALPAPVLEFMFETTRAVTNLVLTKCIERYPRIKFVIPHAGAALPALVDRIAMAAAVMPEMAGTTPEAILATIGKLYFDLAGAPLPRLLPALRTFADPARLLYGSDWPFTPEPVVAKLRARLDEALETNADDLQAIFNGNALRLFPRLSASTTRGK
jgi:predicted TIM-barrel fold metal-dependent hydrolase